MRRVSPTVSSLTTESLRRSMIPMASGRPQSMGSTTVDKSSDFTWPPVATRMDSSDLGNGDTPQSKRRTTESLPGPGSRDRASPPRKIRFSTGSHYARAPSVEDIPGHSICAAAGALNADRKWRNVYGRAGDTLAYTHTVLPTRAASYTH